MAECRLCPRQCGTDREASAGHCGTGAEILVGRAAPHFGEEPCISGTRGSGAVFFSGCPLGCVYCQNYELSRARCGVPVSEERLAEIFRSLEAQGVHNLNLVTGTQYAPSILRALRAASPEIPVVWNTSGYETVPLVRALRPLVPVFLADMKYLLPETAARYSGAEDYPLVAAEAIREMVRLTGPYRTDGDGMLIRGVLIRHLVLPGQAENTRRVIEWVAETFSPGEVMFSLMAQYTPRGDLRRFPELSRPLSEKEWDAAVEALEESGIGDGYVQELSSSGEEEIPAFDGTGVL